METQKDIKTDATAVVTTAAGFIISTAAAYYYEWNLQEYCWTVWVSSLYFSYAYLLSWIINLILSATEIKEMAVGKYEFIREIPGSVFLIIITAASLFAGYLFFYAYTWIFGFYGIFLSVFSEMEPHSLFGRNGFINSDFFTPLVYLTEKMWPMIAGTIISGLEIFFSKKDWRKTLIPFQESRILSVHLMVVLMPFATIIAWMIAGDNYHFPVILFLNALFFIIPAHKSI